MVGLKRNINLKVKRLDNKTILPSYAHEGDACMDITVNSVEYNPELDEYIYGTGLSVETSIPAAMFIHPRSSNHKTNYYLTNSVAVIDCKTYRGEIKLIFKHRDTIRQRLAAIALEQVNQLPWYQKIFFGYTLEKTINKLKENFYADPIKWAPYKPGERAAQMWLHPIRPITITETDELTPTDRGDGGFGSTGK